MFSYLLSNGRMPGSAIDVEERDMDAFAAKPGGYMVFACVLCLADQAFATITVCLP
jgi:hypothetical protein